MTPGANGQRNKIRINRIVSPLGRLWQNFHAADAQVLEAPPEPDQVEPPIQDRISLRDRERVEALQRDLDFSFHNQVLLREALTHRSYLNEIDQAWPSNERLELLGDAVLGLITTDYPLPSFSTTWGKGS